MIDKDTIIKAAEQAFRHADEATQSPGEFHPGWSNEYDRKLYEIAYRQGLEDAAKCCEAEQDLAEQERSDKRFKEALKNLHNQKETERNAVDRGDHWMTVSTCNAVLRNAAKAIRALGDQHA